MSSAILELDDIVGHGRRLASEAIAQRAASYWNSAPMRAKALLMPRSTIEVSEILRWCHANDQSVVTQGGLTGCVGGAESTSDDLVVSLEKMNRIVEIEPVEDHFSVEGLR